MPLYPYVGDKRIIGLAVHLHWRCNLVMCECAAGSTHAPINLILGVAWSFSNLSTTDSHQLIWTAILSLQTLIKMDLFAWLLYFWTSFTVLKFPSTELFFGGKKMVAESFNLVIHYPFDILWNNCYTIENNGK